MLGKFHDAIKIAEEIIDLALEAQLFSIVREQQEFISQFISDYVETRKISLEQNTQKMLQRTYEKSLIIEEDIKSQEISELSDGYNVEQENLKKELKQLKKRFDNYIGIDDIRNAGEILKSAKELLKDLLEEEIKKKWEENEKKYLKRKRRYDLIEKIEKSIEEIQKYRAKFQFREAKLKIETSIQSIEHEDLPQYTKKLDILKEDVSAAEIKFNKFYPKLMKLTESLKKEQKNKMLDKALKNCEEIIFLSQELGIIEIESEHKLILKKIKKEIEETRENQFKEIKIIINQLRDKGLDFLNKGNLVGALENYNKIVKNLSKFMN
ncbi:MAG: hypothetical protein ACFFAN_09460 [Promethearchaeota archaeon]